MRGIQGKPYRLPISHPMADELSFFVEPRQETAWEAAFFKGGKWVTDTIPGLEAYRDYAPGDYTCTYRYIPSEILISLIGEWSSL